MNSDRTNHDGRQEPRAALTVGIFPEESVFGDPRWVAEHLDWIRRHYQRAEASAEAAT